LATNDLDNGHIPEEDQGEYDEYDDSVYDGSAVDAEQYGTYYGVGGYSDAPHMHFGGYQHGADAESGFKTTYSRDFLMAMQYYNFEKPEGIPEYLDVALTYEQEWAMWQQQQMYRNRPTPLKGSHRRRLDEADQNFAYMAGRKDLMFQQDLHIARPSSLNAIRYERDRLLELRQALAASDQLPDIPSHLQYLLMPAASSSVSSRSTPVSPSKTDPQSVTHSTGPGKETFLALLKSKQLQSGSSAAKRSLAIGGDSKSDSKNGPTAAKRGDRSTPLPSSQSNSRCNTPMRPLDGADAFAPLHKSAQKWVAQKASDEKSAAVKAMLGILNKLAPEKLDNLVAMTLAIPITCGDTLRTVVDLIFEKAISEPSFGRVYAKYCQKLHGSLPEFSENGQVASLQSMLRSKCFFNIVDESDRAPVCAVAPNLKKSPDMLSSKSAGPAASPLMLARNFSKSASIGHSPAMFALSPSFLPAKSPNLAPASSRASPPMATQTAGASSAGAVSSSAPSLSPVLSGLQAFTLGEAAAPAAFAVSFSAYQPPAAAPARGLEVALPPVAGPQPVKTASASSTVPLESDAQRSERVMQQRQLGTVTLMGELYKHQLLPESVLHLFLSQALDDLIAPDHHELEAACRLLITAGQLLDGPRSRSQMDDFMSRLQRLSADQGLPSRLRFMILDILELRRSGWVPHRAATVDPKSLAEVKEELERERSQSSHSAKSSRMGTPLSLMRTASAGSNSYTAHPPPALGLQRSTSDGVVHGNKYSTMQTPRSRYVIMVCCATFIRVGFAWISFFVSLIFYH
jgi:hypothetical protein